MVSGRFVKLNGNEDWGESAASPIARALLRVHRTGIKVLGIQAINVGSCDGIKLA